ncbi:hypothetical protein C3V43_11510 [Bacteroides heparinolyticus]|uniref:Uncharacterized protein n=1 Tax=Prevotella heparinolytica TaxID=28113 RepID=A0A2R3MTI9_9BACE|nr:DUF6078 family protein [Bacteroides heparinolyticus]AVM58303.1 hypothetical protein C3V43_11510 [Bacteroides heparinolyticus]TCO93739.1 hypothetical protein EV202_10630 [Bacteroides heparinolyticus]
MENNFDYQAVPYDYAHCFNNRCTQSSQCLRHLVAKNSTSQCPTLRIVNPNCIPADTAACPYFNSTQKLHVAWGLKHLLDNVPYKHGNAIRHELISHFGKTNYYRHYRQERALLPQDQEYIRQLFRSYGITAEPQFERYSDEYYYD